MSNPKRRHTASHNPIYYEDGTSSQRFYTAGSDYVTTHSIPSPKSMFNPPLHLHLWQTENFRVTKGGGVWYQPTAPTSIQRIVMKAGDPPVHLPAGTFHRFEHDGGEEELVVDIKLNPETGGAVEEERFFRNILGYLEDCRLEGTAPSLFQLELFFHTIDGSLAIPVPGPDWLKWWISRLFMLLTGVVIGEWLLGYKRSYPEYYQENSQSKKD